MSLVRYARVAVVGTVIVALGAAALWPEPIAVDVDTVVRGSMQVTIDEEGETRVRERFVVSAPVAGRLLRVELEPGDRVDCGRTVVARLAPTEAPLIDLRMRAELTAAVASAQAALGQAQADRDRAAGNHERARSALRRQATLIAAGAISADELEAAQTAAGTAESALQAATFAVARMENELRRTRAQLQAPARGVAVVDLRAPADGVILRRFRESESVVPAGEPLLEIGDPGDIEVVTDLLSSDAVRVAPGSPAWIESWGGGTPLRARVRRIEPSGFLKVSALGVEERRVNVVLAIADPTGAALALADGYRVEVRVVTWSDDEAVKVPIGALFRQGESWSVFVVERNRARLRSVVIGQQNDREAQIERGLAPGAVVVLHPPDTLRDGARVRERRD